MDLQMQVYHTYIYIYVERERLLVSNRRSVCCIHREAGGISINPNTTVLRRSWRCTAQNSLHVTQHPREIAASTASIYLSRFCNIRTSCTQIGSWHCRKSTYKCIHVWKYRSFKPFLKHCLYDPEESIASRFTSLDFEKRLARATWKRPNTIYPKRFIPKFHDTIPPLCTSGFKRSPRSAARMRATSSLANCYLVTLAWRFGIVAQVRTTRFILLCIYNI